MCAFDRRVHVNALGGMLVASTHASICGKHDCVAVLPNYGYTGAVLPRDVAGRGGVAVRAHLAGFHLRLTQEGLDEGSRAAEAPPVVVP